MLRASRAIAVVQAPVVLTQGRRLKRHHPASARRGAAVDGRARRAATRCGCWCSATPRRRASGAATQHEALPGRLADALHARTGRGIRWRAAGKNGATAREIIVADYLDDALAEPADLLFLTIGANDAMTDARRRRVRARRPPHPRRVRRRATPARSC